MTWLDRLRWARYFVSRQYGDRCWWCARHALIAPRQPDTQAFRWSLYAACRKRAGRL